MDCYKYKVYLLFNENKEIEINKTGLLRTRKSRYIHTGAKMTTYELLKKNIGKTFPFEVDGVRLSVDVTTLTQDYQEKVMISIKVKISKSNYDFINCVIDKEENQYDSHDDKDKALIKQALKAIEEASHGKG
jgi:hypothetical protein